MKTTLEIPDALFRRAKARAAERGQTLKALALQHRMPILSRNEHFDVVAGIERKSC